MLQGQYNALEERYQNLLIERTDLEGLPLLGTIETVEQTPSKIPVEMAALAALVVGLGLSLGVLVLSERLIGPVWTANDAGPVHFLPSVVTRPRGGVGWYLKSGSSKRKSAIQLMRSTIRARAKGDEFVLAIVRSGVGAHDAHTLGVDLASAFASTSVQTALIDASFDTAWRQPEFRHHAFTLHEVVDADEETINSLVDSASSSDGALQDDLMVISAGEPGVSVDVLAGPAVSHLIDVLRRRDVVIVLCDEIGSATTQALLDRCDMVLVTRPGVTTRPLLSCTTRWPTAKSTSWLLSSSPPSSPTCSVRATTSASGCTGCGGSVSRSSPVPRTGHRPSRLSLPPCRRPRPRRVCSSTRTRASRSCSVKRRAARTSKTGSRRLRPGPIARRSLRSRPGSPLPSRRHRGWTPSTTSSGRRLPKQW